MRSPHIPLVFVLATGVCALWISGLSAAQTSNPIAPIVADGASFSEPKGWTRLAPDKPKTKGWFISPDSDRAAPKLMIMVDVGKPVDPSIASTAEKMARNWGGTVLKEKTTLDGVEAIRVRSERPRSSIQPVEAVIAVRGDKLYMLMGGAISGRSVVEPVEEVRKSWKWTEGK
jgi:hypothetical protein